MGHSLLGQTFENYLKERGIKHKKSSVAYPHGNGQVEVTNRILLRGIEKRLKESKNRWPEELPNVLWAYRTSPQARTGETPFKLAYGTEAMLPIEVGSPSYRAITFEEVANEEGIRTNLELIEEVRDQAVQRMKKYKEKTRAYFSMHTRVKNFQPGDLVLWDVAASDPTNTGKLQPNWEGPYKVEEVLHPGTYKLSHPDGSEVPNTWHGLRQLHVFILLVSLVERIKVNLWWINIYTITCLHSPCFLGCTSSWIVLQSLSTLH